MEVEKVEDEGGSDEGAHCPLDELIRREVPNVKVDLIPAEKRKETSLVKCIYTLFACA